MSTNNLYTKSTELNVTIDNKFQLSGLYQPDDKSNSCGYLKAGFEMSPIGQNKDGSPKYAIKIGDTLKSFVNVKIVDAQGEVHSLIGCAFDKRTAESPESFGLRLNVPKSTLKPAIFTPIATE